MSIGPITCEIAGYVGERATAEQLSNVGQRPAEEVMAIIRAMTLAERQLLFGALEYQIKMLDETGFVVLRKKVFDFMQEVTDSDAKTKQELFELIATLDKEFAKRNPKPRNTDRDDEIVRLRDEILPDGKRRTFGQIVPLLKGRWPELTRAAAIRAYNRKKKPAK